MGAFASALVTATKGVRALALLSAREIDRDEFTD